MLYTYINILNRIFTATQGVQKQLDQCLQINLKKDKNGNLLILYKVL